MKARAGRRGRGGGGGVARRPRLAAAISGALAAGAFLAACAGDGAPRETTGGGTPAVAGTPAARASPSPSPAQAGAAVPAATATPTPAARADGLSGAPVPAPSPAGAAFERGRLNERAGSFPSLDFPQVVPAAQASFMTADTLVCGATQNGEARAYPLFMLQFHHIANDTLGGLPYLVTF